MDFVVRTMREAWWTINCAISEPKILLGTYGDYGYTFHRRYQ
jgi:hypothetical protein